MKRSKERILTTHTGSLPRPPDLVEMMVQSQDGKADTAKLAARIRESVAEIAQKQSKAGVDIVNDGEMSKVSYATYIKDRLTGFEGEGGLFHQAEFDDFPEFGERYMESWGTLLSIVRMPACVADIRVKDPNAVNVDIANLRAATSSLPVEEIFMTAASPGVIALFFSNEHYSNREEYMAAIAEAMRAEYEAIVGAGFLLQLDCPDLAMGRAVQFHGEPIEVFRREARLNIEALNAATRNIDPDRMRMHLCWGNHEGPHHLDMPLRDIIDVVFTARPNAIAIEASNPRHAHEWRVFEDIHLPDGKLLIPGVIDSTNNYIEHPELVAQRLVRYANLVGMENVIAGSDCGFGTWVGRSVVDARITWAKFQSMAEGARLATQELAAGKG